MEKNDDILLEVKDLHASLYTDAGEVQAVRGINYKLRRGEVLGIVGESGCGKSISTACILSLLPASGRVTQGEILFEGRNLLKMSRHELMDVRGNEIAMIFQDPMTSLDSLFSVGYQIDESLRRHTSLSKKERHDRIIELLKMVGISEPERRMKQFPHEFSGGMRQRVMIAMALACNPKLLIADEPTTALDVTIQAQIIDLIREIKNKIGMAVIFITHDMGVVADISDRIAVMYAGKFVETGDKRSIFYHPRHPYTKGILASVPHIDEENEKLVGIDGNPPDLVHVPSACPFAPRCGECSEKCKASEPELSPVPESEDHACACFLNI
ncbi:MAG TPA: ABC transporter ATP-binding protein [Lachnospiraceae bacterium]|nr:ABC transporter ATP-binding protein [Lachnospiraceae bacterium]